jgi:hypothetical protein
MKGTIEYSGEALTLFRLYKETQLLSEVAAIPGYTIEKIHEKAGKGFFFEGKLVARFFWADDFYSFLKESKVNWRKLISMKMVQDFVLLIVSDNVLFVGDTSVRRPRDEEELMLCDFKRKQYQKLVTPLGLKVEYVFVLSDWFKKPEYKDVLDYINSVNCHYKFNELPLAWLGLPTRNN